MKIFVSILALTLFLSGCAVHSPEQTDAPTQSMDAVEDKVNLGDSKEEVLGLLTPDYDLAMKVRYLKDAEKYIPDGSVVEIYYMKSTSTDGEITPYMFVDDQLTGMGWDVVDGPSMEASAEGSAD
jgi:hypothetical protein